MGILDKLLLENNSRFRDREEAGQFLAQELAKYARRRDAVVLALPRGGVPVGYQVAEALHLPLDVMVVRKLGVPGHEELAMGAIASGGIMILERDQIRYLGISEEAVNRVIEKEEHELERREILFRGDLPPLDINGKTAILVDDGLATGSSMRAAVRAVRRLGAKRIVVAVPVAPSEACESFEREVDEMICARTPAPFYAVGIWYENFEQTPDDEVRHLLEKAHAAIA